MPIQPFFVLYRKRILYAALFSLLCALLLLFWTTAESPTDIGILWHHFCGCPPDPLDTRALLNFPSFTCFVVGILFGVGLGSSGQSVGISGPQSNFRTLFTRPASRLSLFLTPVLFATIAIILFPALGLLLLLGWLYLVHAPALGHLVDIVRLIPSAAAIGPHPSLASILTATHYLQRYLGSISLGLCGYAAFYGQRWWILSSSKWVRLGAIVPIAFSLIPLMAIISNRFTTWLMLMPSRGDPLGYLAPISLIALHFAFAFACLYSCWRVARMGEV